MGSPLAAWVDRALSLTPARAGAFGLRELAALLLPTSCALCQAPDHRLCPRCARQLVAQLHLPPLGPALRCRLELPQHQELFLVCAAGLYANELAQAILAFKNRQRVFLAAQFAPYLAAVAAALSPPCVPGEQVWLVPVPASPAARTRRGYWPVQRILCRAQADGLIPARLSCRAILRHRFSLRPAGAQKGKSRSQRRSSGGALYAFDAARPGQQVLLVDDVVTTGATLIAAANACRAAGYRVIGAVALALTPPPSTETK